MFDIYTPSLARGTALGQKGLKKLRSGSTLGNPCGNCNKRRYSPCKCKKRKG